MPPAGEHGPFLGRTWLVTSTPLPPSHVHVMAGLRSFEARRETASQPATPERQQQRRRRRNKPRPPPRSSSLRRMRGTVSETDLRGEDDRPASPATSAYSEDQTHYCRTIFEDRPTFSTFYRPPVCETIEEGELAPLVEAGVGDSVVSVEVQTETADNDMVWESEARVLSETEESSRTDTCEDSARNTTIASIDRILSSMHSLQMALETTSEEGEPPPLPPPPSGTDTDEMSLPAAPHQSLPNATPDTQMSLEDMFSEIENLYDSLKGNASEYATSVSGDNVINHTTADPPSEPVYANVKLISRISDKVKEDARRPCKNDSIKLGRKHLNEQPKVPGKLTSCHRGLSESDYMACSTPKLHSKRLASHSSVPPPPTTAAPPAPENQYDVPRRLGPIETVYDTPRVTPVRAAVDSSIGTDDFSRQSARSETLVERANELFGRSTAVLNPVEVSNTNMETGTNGGDGVHTAPTQSGSRDGNPAPAVQPHVSVTSSREASGALPVAVRSATRTLSEARRRAVELVVGDQLQLPAVPTHDPASARPDRSSGRSTPSTWAPSSGRSTPAQEPSTATSAGRTKWWKPPAGVHPGPAAQTSLTPQPARKTNAAQEAKSRLEELPSRHLPGSDSETCSEVATPPEDTDTMPGDNVITHAHFISDLAPEQIVSEPSSASTKKVSDLLESLTKESAEFAHRKASRSSSAPAAPEPELPVRSSSLHTRVPEHTPTSGAPHTAQRSRTLVTVDTQVVTSPPTADTCTPAPSGGGGLAEERRSSSAPPLALSVPVSERVQQLQQQLQIQTTALGQRSPGGTARQSAEQQRPPGSCQVA